MAWTAPMTFSNAVLTAAQLNTYIRDNLNETAAAKATSSGTFFAGTGTNSLAERFPSAAAVSTSETTASTTFVDLATVGPSVTSVSGTKVLLSLTALVSNNTVNAESDAAVDISGSHTAAAVATFGIRYTSATANARMQASYVTVLTVTAGTSTYNMQYAVSAGTGTFAARRMSVVPF